MSAFRLAARLRARIRAPFLVLLAGLSFAGCAPDVRLPTEPEATTVRTDARGAPGTAASDRFVAGRVLARFAPGSDAAAVAAAHGAALGPGVIPGVLRLDVPAGRELAVASALSRNPNVEFAEPDWLRLFSDPIPATALPTDPLFGYKWDLHNDGTVNNAVGDVLATTGAVDADVDWAEMHEALGPDFAGSAVIGIMDSGVRASHEDFCGRILARKDFVGSTDGADDNGHGTHVTGIAAGCADNGLGLSGVAYGRNVRVVMAKVCGPTFFGLLYSCPTSAIAAGIYWAVDEMGADVLNLSLGGATGSETERLALAHAVARGALPVCAAGNDGGPVSYPAAFDECLAVSATDWGDDLASYSNFGPQIAVAAPGGDSEDPQLLSAIASTCRDSDSHYCIMGGTSMASPQVAGLAAILVALGAGGPAEVRQVLESTADDLGAPGYDDRFGAGRINAAAAVAAVTGGEPPPPPPPPEPVAPTADFTWSCDALSCQFTDASSDPDGTIVAWSWSFGGDGTSSVQNPSHTFSAADSWTVTLEVTDQDGLTDSVAREVPVTDEPPPPPPGEYAIHVADIDGRVVKGAKGTWKPEVRVLVVDTNGDPVAAAQIGGLFSGGLSEPENGITDSDGWATILPDASLKGGGTSVTYTILAVVSGLTPWARELDTDPDGDSDGSSIVITR